MQRRRAEPRLPGKMRGVGLIEILIAVLVLAVGLLGIAMMQAMSLRNSQSALESSQATTLTYTILDAMRANRDVALIGGYDLTAFTCNPPAGGTLAGNDRRAWILSLKDALGDNACGAIKCDTKACNISVRWDDSRGLGGSGDEVVNTTTQL